MLLKKLHQASMAAEVFAVELGVSWRPALESKALAFILLQSGGKRSLQGRQTHEEAMSH